MHHSNKEELLHSTSNSTNQYQETVQYLFSMLPMYQRIGKPAFKADLNNTVQLCMALGNPQEQIKTVHIAGTNGKGSVAHILAAILQAAGYKTGLYTSPHYKDFRERIKINSQPISEKAVIDFTKRIQPQIERLKPSFFEITVAMAFDFFYHEKTDINVIETGLGGRLDSTNVLLPELSVITNIDLEHTQFLGDTIQQIAYEKAGIIKEGVPVVTGSMHQSALDVIKEIAQNKKSLHQSANQKVFIEAQTGKHTFSITIDDEIKLHDLLPELTGKFQHENYQTAVSAAMELRKCGFQINEKHIKIGIEHTRTMTNMLGRWQMLGVEPFIFADGAHNPHALRAIRNEIESIKHTKLHLVMGFVNDKDVQQMLELLPANAIYYFSKPDVPRGLDVDQIKPIARKLKLEYYTYQSAREAFTAARVNALHDDLILICGSIFTVGEILP